MGHKKPLSSRQNRHFHSENAQNIVLPPQVGRGLRDQENQA